MEPSNGSIWSGRRSVDALRVRPPQKNIHSNSCARQVTIHDRKVFLAPFACTDHDIHFRCFSRSCHGLSANAVATRGACLPSWPLRPRLVVFLRARVGPFLAPSWRGRWLRWLAGGGKPPQPASQPPNGPWLAARKKPTKPASQCRKQGLSGDSGSAVAGSVAGQNFGCFSGPLAGFGFSGFACNVFALLRQPPASRFHGHELVAFERAERRLNDASFYAGRNGPFTL